MPDKSLFDAISQQASKLTTQRYSTSFSLGIRCLAPHLRQPIYNIYGFVRFADEIVDSFHQYNREALLQAFRADTYRALDDGISLNPILNSFQQTVHEFGIERDLIDTFLHSMEMDLTPQAYDRSTYEQYILGSAEVVGLMCLHVFCEGNNSLYQHLKPTAMRLGAAFQKINFLRDLKEDQQLLQRTYFPQLDTKQFDWHTKSVIESEIEEDFKAAYQGIIQLPLASRHGVYLAYVYYQRLFRKIKSTQPDIVLQKRIRVPNAEKMMLLLNSYIRHNLNIF